MQIGRLWAMVLGVLVAAVLGACGDGFDAAAAPLVVDRDGGAETGSSGSGGAGGASGSSGADGGVGGAPGGADGGAGASGSTNDPRCPSEAPKDGVDATSIAGSECGADAPDRDWSCSYPSEACVCTWWCGWTNGVMACSSRWECMPAGAANGPDCPPSEPGAGSDAAESCPTCVYGSRLCTCSEFAQNGQTYRTARCVGLP